MSINKEDLFKDFLAKKQQKSEERQNVMNKEKKYEEANKTINSDNANNNKKNVRNKKRNNNKNIKPNISNDILDEYSKFKNEFLSNQVVKDFMTSLDLYRERGFNMFDDNETFIKAKYEHPNCRAVIVEPSLADITVGKGGNVYIVKPMYQKEYMNFQKIIGDRATHNEEFITYSLMQCTLYPENLTESDIEKIGAGTIITLYNTISNLSDFNKSFTVVEV